MLNMTEDLIGSGGASAGSRYAAEVARLGVIDGVRQAVAAARRMDDLVVWVGVGFLPGYQDCPAGSSLFQGVPGTGAFREGTPSSMPLVSLGRLDSEPFIVKARVSPFYGTRLAVLLQTVGVTGVVLAGVATEHVVLAAARDAHDHDLTVTILTDATSSSSEDLRQAALLVARSFTEQVSVAQYAQSSARR